MADPRTFVLIGEFKDGITPELQKINNQLASLKNSFASIGGKGARKSARDIGRFKGAVDTLNETLKTQNQVLRSTIEPMRQYRREVGKTVGALKRLDQAGGRAITVERTNKALEQQIRLMDQLRARGVGSYVPPPGGGGRRGVGRGGRGGSGGGGGRGDFSMAEFGFAYTLGNAIAQPIQNAVVSGFQIGVGLMTKPFEYFANRLGERMQDELSDLKAAGGFFSMAQRQKEPFVKNFADAIQFTQDNNKIMARLAASLPGKTQDYIEVAKRISDSVARTVLNDRAGTMKMAEEIRAGDIKTYGAKSITEMTSNEATKKTIQVLLGDMTKDTVLAGMGGRAGAGGAMGAYGLPQLSERMISQDEVSMGQMQRYSAIFSDPMIMDALQRNINKINATSKNSADRLKAIAAMYKEIVTPELVERYRRTLSGVAETFNTAIFGEETGLFGLGRKMEGLGVRFNEFGQMVNEQGDVVTRVADAAREDLAIYDLFRDILANVGQVLAPIVENLSLIYDPLKKLGFDLSKAREVTFKILASFNQYKAGFEDYGKKFKGKEKEKFDATRDFRAALLTIGNVMRFYKVIGEGDFANLLKDLKDPNVNLAKILQGMIDKVLNSNIATRVGEFVGSIVGTVLSEVAKATGFISGRIEKSNKLIDGLKKGFNDAGGPKAFRNIFKDVFKTMFRVLMGLLKILPLEAYVMAGLAIIAPAAIQGLAMQIGTKVWEAVTKNLLGGATRVTGSGAGGGLGLSRLIGPIGAVIAALVLFEGGLENATRQFTSGLGQMGNSLSDVFETLSYALSRLTGKTGDLTGEIDSIGIALLPVSAGLDLIVQGSMGLIEAWDNVVLVFYRFANWLASESWLRGAYSDKDRERYAAKVSEAEGRVKTTTDLRNKMKMEGDAYRTGLRYGGTENYINKLREDLASKEARLGSAGLLKAERQKLNDDIYWLRKMIASTTDTGSTGGKTTGQTPPSPIFTPPPPGTPATPPPVPKEITDTAQNTSALNTKAATHITHAASTDKASNETKKNTATANTVLGNIKAGLISVSNKLTGIQNAVLSDLNNIQAGVASISSLLSSGSLKVKAEGMGPNGGPMGSAKGDLGRAQSLASQYGLSMTSWFRPGSKGYHGVGRAMDFSNGVGTPQQMEFAQAMVAQYGTSLKELIYTPLGFGIKDGTRVPLSYWGAATNAGHYDHVHVAFANGPQDGRMFTRRDAAGEWEKSMVPGSVKVASITGNSSEGFGTSVSMVNNITVNGAGQDAEQIAARVADLLADAVSTRLSATIY